MKAIFQQGGSGVCVARNRSVLPGEYAVETKLRDWSKGKTPLFLHGNRWRADAPQ